MDSHKTAWQRNWYSGEEMSECSWSVALWGRETNEDEEHVVHEKVWKWCGQQYWLNG